MSNPGWTKERLTQLIALWNEGRAGTAIAKIMGATRGSVLGKVHRLDRENPELFAERRAIIAARPVCSPAPRGQSTRRAPMPKREPETPLVTNPANILDIGPAQCRFHLDSAKTPATASTLFCGAPVQSGSPYCPHHAARVYVPRKPKSAPGEKRQPNHSLAVFGAW